MSPFTVDPAHLTRRHLMGLGSLAFAGVALSACSPPGEEIAADPTGGAEPGASLPTTLAENPGSPQVFFDLVNIAKVEALCDEFTKQHPQLTFDVKSDSFQNMFSNTAKILTSENPPDLMQLPSVGQEAKAGILTNLEPYAEAYGWDKWSQDLLNQNRVEDDGTRGRGPLYGVGIGYNVTGMFYNIKIAEELGLQMPPATLGEFEQACLSAVEAGIGGLAASVQMSAAGLWILQLLQAQYGDVDAIQNWSNNLPGATIEVPGMLKAAETMQAWMANGIIPEDAIATDYVTALGEFQNGKFLFTCAGDWEAKAISDAMGEDVGFFVLPGLEADSELVAPCAPGTAGVAIGADNKDEIAYFLNWMHTDAAAREILVNVGGVSPGGPTDLPLPEATTPLIAQTTQAFQKVTTEGRAVDFFTNGSSSLGITVVLPEIQALLLGSVTPEEFLKNIQTAYEAELGR